MVIPSVINEIPTAPYLYGHNYNQFLWETKTAVRAVVRINVQEVNNAVSLSDNIHCTRLR